MYFPLPSLYFDAVRSPDKMLVHPSIHEPVAVRRDVFIFARTAEAGGGGIAFRPNHKKSTQTQKLYSLKTQGARKGQRVKGSML